GTQKQWGVVSRVLLREANGGDVKTYFATRHLPIISAFERHGVRRGKRKHSMSAQDAALIVIDVQNSFRHRPYWNDSDVSLFLDRLQALIDGARERSIPVVQVFHIENDGAFSLASGHVETFTGLSIKPDVIFHKRSHSALIGSGLDVWLVQHGIRRVIISGIRSEQCCETTTPPA